MKRSKPNYSLQLIKYGAVFFLAIKDKLFYPAKLLAQFFVNFVRVTVLLLLYSYAFKYTGGSIKGISYEIAAWSIVVYFIFFALSIRFVFKQINEDVKTGKIESFLNKPFNYLLYRILYQLGSGVGDMVFSALIAVTLLIIFIGMPQIIVSSLWVLLVVGITIFSITLAYIIYSIIGLVSIWIDNAQPVYWIFDKFIMILGGAFVPIALFPELLRQIALFTPFGAIMFPVYIFYPNFMSIAPILLLAQVGWSLTLGAFLYYFFTKAQKNISINGG